MILSNEASETKNKIFNVAAELFTKNGYDSVSVREICEKSGVTKPVLYYYFKDKENLILDLVNETKNLSKILQAKYIHPESSLRENLEGIIKFYVEFASKYPEFVRFSAFVQFMSVPEKVREIKFKANEEMMGLFITYLNSEKEKGNIIHEADPELLAVNYIGTIIMFFTKYLLYLNHLETFEKKMYKFVDM
ncbi:MAG: TetR/AcrR family transcriptional regulator, partial [Melioribacteraceae bacterium]|nr:TetR/AcrR family transcriptional regulator [Melioribacteraceae bacterium]